MDRLAEIANAFDWAPGFGKCGECNISVSITDGRSATLEGPVLA
jgi:hypothetical protein